MWQGDVCVLGGALLFAEIPSIGRTLIFLIEVAFDDILDSNISNTNQKPGTAQHDSTVVVAVIIIKTPSKLDEVRNCVNWTGPSVFLLTRQTLLSKEDSVNSAFSRLDSSTIFAFGAVGVPGRKEITSLQAPSTIDLSPALAATLLTGQHPTHTFTRRTCGGLQHPQQLLAVDLQSSIFNPTSTNSEPPPNLRAPYRLRICDNRSLLIVVVVAAAAVDSLSHARAE
ncbi:uncharacterized protein LY89DRAFT_676598 [Mollisia scopiformis]|uniref:Uncharacterized protein n=1 Tax=Mollisia scopiformis TaxID=149040 RepID=A0A132B8F9_MOLSC|nr:uncharacterized protein LY89DRAFT_676598 [Mollisia scopiformis]KUJ08685.1 hypothetical protein LY89DRAFT_676598 [Mollisia scopiformis]